MTIDASRFPHLADYLAKLPNGLQSYPKCLAKGVLVRSAVEDHRFSGALGTLPPTLKAAIETPPPVSVWVPATISDATFYVVVDTHYQTKDKMLAWIDRRTLALARSSMYRMLVKATKPGTFLKLAAKVHTLFQRGTDLEVRPGEGYADVRLSHPPHLHGGFNHLSNVALFRSLIATTGGKDVKAEMTASTATEARYHVTWR